MVPGPLTLVLPGRKVAAEQAESSYTGFGFSYTVTKELFPAMLRQDLVYFSHGKFIKLNDRSLGPVGRRQDISGILFGVCFNRYPCLMDAILAAPIGLRGKMGAIIQKAFNNLGTGQQLFFMRNFDKKFWHRWYLLELEYSNCPQIVLYIKYNYGFEKYQKDAKR